MKIEKVISSKVTQSHPTFATILTSLLSHVCKSTLEICGVHAYSFLSMCSNTKRTLEHITRISHIFNGWKNI